MDMSTEKKILIFGTIATILLIVGGILITSKQDKRLSTPLVGQEVKVESADHVPDGTELTFNSNPPSSGSHYVVPQPAGVYDTAPPDGKLVHSLEHGAVIFWYREDLPKSEVEKLKGIFDQKSGKKIMTPRKDLDVPVALSSWGRVLKLEKIDEAAIIEFFETNHDRGPEKAPI